LLERPNPLQPANSYSLVPVLSNHVASSGSNYDTVHNLLQLVHFILKIGQPVTSELHHCRWIHIAPASLRCPGLVLLLGADKSACGRIALPFKSDMRQTQINHPWTTYQYRTSSHLHTIRPLDEILIFGFWLLALDLNQRDVAI
jgi:hypothetical protein